MKNTEIVRHTPGPWRVEIGLGETLNTYSIFDEANQMGFIPEIVVPVDEEKSFHVEAEANARLIAAAPELLEALEGMRKAFSLATNHNQAIAQDIASGAIRKAKGEL